MSPFLQNNILTTYASDVNDICSPLNKLGITGFIFMRHFPDGSFIDLSNQLPWSLFFLEQFFAEKYPTVNLQDHMFISEGVSLWYCNPENVIWQEGQQLFNFGNGVSILIDRKEYKDIFCFYGNINDYSLNNFYINNISFLHRFCDQFLIQAARIIQIGYKNKLITPEAYRINNCQKKIVSDSELFSYPLSKKEIKCVKLSALGLSAQEIAQALFLSKRTVESHIANSKAKLNCKSISELIYTAVKQNFID